MRSTLDITLWLAGVGHFCILIASFQVPRRLGWKEDLLKLSSMNRKLMWTYAAFTVLTIIAFGTLTLVLHDELLLGHRAALGLAAFIGLYWSARVLIDICWFGHRDWPKGLRFVVAHIALTLLFLALSATYWSLVVWHICSH